MPRPYPDQSCLIDLPLDRSAPAAARRLVADVVGAHPRLADVLLATSEIMTNAVLHAPERVRQAILLADTDGATVRVAVRHEGPGFRFQGSKHRARDRPGGRGLAILSRLATRWGVQDDGMFEVWFEVGPGTPEPTSGASSRLRSPPRRRGHRGGTGEE